MAKALDVDPVEALLRADQDKEDMLRNLGDSLRALVGAMEQYRADWKAARNTGWAGRDLTRVGFIDPQRLPRAVALPERKTTSIPAADDE